MSLAARIRSPQQTSFTRRISSFQIPAASGKTAHIFSVVDFARRKTAEKRGGSAEIVTLHSSDAALEIQLDEMLALDSALDHLNQVDPRLGQVVELRFFGGLSPSEIAAMLGVTTRTIERDWIKARLFLLKELDPERG
jgi:RNA polymerase sigma factor (TIGR02999 family)